MTPPNNRASVEPSGGRSLWWTFSLCLTLKRNATNLGKLETFTARMRFHWFFTVPRWECGDKNGVLKNKNNDVKLENAVMNVYAKAFFRHQSNATFYT